MTDTSSSPKPVEVFFSYSHKDEELRDELAIHLKMLQRQGIIQNWHDREISAGTEWAGKIDQKLNSARLILLLISPNFLGSDYCYDLEMTQAMKRHEAGDARVVPIILRPVDWNGAPFERLQALPKNAKPVTTWSNRDEAFLNIAQGIRKTVQELIVPSRQISESMDLEEEYNQIKQEYQNVSTAKRVEFNPPSRRGAVTISSDNSPFAGTQASGNANVSQTNAPQSFNMNGGTISGQVNFAARDLIQTQHNNSGDRTKPLATEDVIQLIAQIEGLLKHSLLPTNQKGKTLHHLQSVKNEVEANEPDKEFAAQNLKKIVDTLKSTNEAVDAGQSLWTKVEPILSQLLPWLGVASKFLGF
jgi:hypothetical protein